MEQADLSYQNKENLSNIRHSCAHLLAAAVKDIYPDAKLAIGPSIENGFYYDIEFSNPINEEDLEKIEKKMTEILPSWNKFEGREVTYEQAKELFKQSPYKIELIEDLHKDNKQITVYKCGDFEDLCRGGHSNNPSQEIGAFKLLSIAGAYWKGNEKNAMLTRIYGTCFSTHDELIQYLKNLEEAKEKDHRKIGKQLHLYTFSDLVGSGLPLFTPEGTILRDQLASFSEELQKNHGFKKVWIPHIAKIDLYKKSGHWAKFGDELFQVKSQETSDEFVLKPMNCPHHTQIYASQTRSYKELPIRYYETTTIYRDEKAGELIGLSRVRSATQDDAHVFCRMDQIEIEFRNIMDMIKILYSTLGMEFKARLSFRDPAKPEKYLGTEKNWNMAQNIIEKVAKDLNLNYYIAEGEAAFYGPKIDIMMIDPLGREYQLATQQLDFVQPERFGLKYTTEEGKEETPVMIHKALLGSIERFLSIYIEYTAGNFPTWISPVQMMIIPITDQNISYGQNILKQLKDSGVRAEIDERSEKMQSKIRDAQMQKIPYMIVVGKKEEESQTVTIRTRTGENIAEIKTDTLLKKILNEIDSKSKTLTLNKD